MMGTTHRTGSIALACGVVALCPKDQISLIPAATFVVASAIGGLFPDADTPYSTYGRRFMIILWPFYLIRKAVSMLGCLIKPLKNVGKALGHRGLFHSPLLWTVIFGLIFAIFKFFGVNDAIAYSILFGGYTGIISHVLLDYISGGVPLLAPVKMKRYTPPIKFKTGGIFEVLFNVAFIGISVLCVLYALPKIGL